MSEEQKENPFERKARHARYKIKRGFDDMDRYGPRTYGREDAKALILAGVEELIEARIGLAQEQKENAAQSQH